MKINHRTLKVVHRTILRVSAFTASFVLFFLAVADTHASAVKLNLPIINGADPGSTPAAFVNWAVIGAFTFVGAAAIISLTIGGFKYFLAAGNMGSLEDAKDQVRSALLGLVIVLSAVVMLNTVNPDLVRLRNLAFPTLTLPEAVIYTPQQADSCTFTSANWGSAKSCYNITSKTFDQVNLTAAGRSCDGWGVSFNIKNASGAPEETRGATFESALAQTSWIPTKAGTYTFEAVAGQGSQLTRANVSAVLTVTNGECEKIASDMTGCGDPALICNTATCPGMANTWAYLIPQVAQQFPIGGGVRTDAFLEAIMRIESGGKIDSMSNKGACGLMQFKPATAELYAAQCGINHPVSCDWLRGLQGALQAGETQEIVARASICMTALYARSVINGACYGSDGIVRDIAAAFNGGSGCNAQSTDDSALVPSVACAGEMDCSNRPTRRYECVWEDKLHTKCNARPDHPGFGETRQYAAKFNACYGTR